MRSIPHFSGLLAALLLSSDVGISKPLALEDVSDFKLEPPPLPFKRRQRMGHSAAHRLVARGKDYSQQPLFSATRREARNGHKKLCMPLTGKAHMSNPNRPTLQEYWDHRAEIEAAKQAVA
jgi:hypothetical protein